MHGVDLYVGGMYYCLWRVTTGAQQYTAVLDVCTVVLYPRKYGLVTSRLGGGSAPTAGSATQLMSLGPDSHHLALIFMWVNTHQYEWGTAVSLLCSVLFMSVPFLILEMSCRQMPLIPREPVRGFVLKLTAGLNLNFCFCLCLFLSDHS